MRILRFSLLAILLSPLVAVAVFYAWKWTDNARFAGLFFDDKVEVVRVVASKRWANFEDGVFACSYAAVEFSEDTAKKLLTRGPDVVIGNGWKRGGQEHWNADWKRTPLEEWRENRPDPFEECLKFLPEKEMTLIHNDLQKGNSWYYRHGQIGQFLSVSNRLAVMVRIGD